VANPLIIVTVPADWGPTGTTRGSTIMGASQNFLNLSNSPMNPANHSMKEKVQ